MELLILVVLLCELGIQLGSCETLLVDQCYYEEIPNFSLEEVSEPAHTLKKFVGHANITDRYDCYEKCCDDKYQIGNTDRCTAVAYYMNGDNELVCKLLNCEPASKCLWSSGFPGKFGCTIRSTKTTTTVPTTTAIETTAAPVINSTSTETPVQNNQTESVTEATNSNVSGQDEDTNNEDNIGTITNNNNDENTNQSTEITGDTLTPVIINQGSTSTSPGKGDTWNWKQHPDSGTSSKPSKPDTVHITPVRRGHQVPIKGLVAGIVLAILLLLVLISFLTRQLRKTIKHPVHYKPINEEEYQKLTVGED